MTEQKTWRVILDVPRTGTYNMALDYAMMKSIANDNSLPTIRIYRWSQPVVTIGYFQIINEEVDEQSCLNDGVSVIRRITGGGAVLHDAELTYSIALPIKSRITKGSIIDSFKDICLPVIETLRSMSISAEFKPVNDITVSGRKISGSAQTRKDGILLQHGTILLDIEGEKMLRYLKTAREKLLGGPYLTCMREFIGDYARTEAFMDEFSREIIASFEKSWGIETIPMSFTQYEQQQAQLLEKEFFLNPSWNQRRICSSLVQNFS